MLGNIALVLLSSLIDWVNDLIVAVKESVSREKIFEVVMEKRCLVLSHWIKLLFLSCSVLHALFPFRFLFCYLFFFNWNYCTWTKMRHIGQLSWNYKRPPHCHGFDNGKSVLYRKNLVFHHMLVWRKWFQIVHFLFRGHGNRFFHTI
jgi:hypothetical protein